jgi:hypothetical protein
MGNVTIIYSLNANMEDNYSVIGTSCESNYDGTEFGQSCHVHCGSTEYHIGVKIYTQINNFTNEFF